MIAATRRRGAQMASWQPRSTSPLLACLLLLLPPAVRGADDSLATRIEKIIAAPEYRASRWGLLVVDLETGRTVYEHEADKLFAPASVTKLYTCGAALAALGPNHRFETPVYRRGLVVDGVLHGDLILVASGDPTLGGRTDAAGRLAFKNQDHTYANWLDSDAELTATDPLAGLHDLARQVRRSGVRKIDGEILIDDRLFAQFSGTSSGPSIITPIMINDNVIDVLITPGEKAGEPAAVRFRPETPFAQIHAQIETVGRDEKPHVEAEHVGLQRYVIRGRVPVGSKPLVRICPMDDPLAFARALFIDCLRRAGVAVETSALRPPLSQLPEPDAYAHLAEIARFKSPPFAEVLKVTLKVSHNVYASEMPLLLAARHGKPTLFDGLREEGRVLAGLGLDVSAVSLDSGAGGGQVDRVTPRVTVQLLRLLSKRPDWAVFKAGLPVLGVDGTLADMGRDSPARGKVHAKTGTYVQMDALNDRLFLRSKSLAGVMTTKTGRSLAFAFFVNNVPLVGQSSPDRESRVMARLCEVLYLEAP
jgi:D-alanyl-D-alanine carboxypeptidase/D-alanyl-D-alanine-endopeptidase (penicillin-binding protein 4)